VLTPSFADSYVQLASTVGKTEQRKNGEISRKPGRSCYPGARACRTILVASLGVSAATAGGTPALPGNKSKVNRMEEKVDAADIFDWDYLVQIGVKLELGSRIP
jgi:hypothetical protein